MAIRDDAIEWVRHYYSTNESLARHPREFGCVFRVDDADQLQRDQMVWSDSDNAVQLYPTNTRADLVSKHAKHVPPRYLGDFHAHPVTVSWAGQLPSPQDLFDTSVAADYWELSPPYCGVDSVRLTPALQIILLLRHGDLLVIDPSVARRAYSDLSQQKADLGAHKLRYAKWHRMVDTRLGSLPQQTTHAAYRAAITAELPAVNQVLCGRCIIGLI